MVVFNYFSISGLCIGFINLALAILITIFSKKRLHKVWSYVNYAISTFGFGIFISGSATNIETALIGWKIFTIGIIFIAVLYYHVIFLFCNLQSSRFLRFCYLQAAFFVLLIIFSNYLFGIAYLPGIHLYYLKAGILFTIFMGIWSAIVGKSFYELFKYIKKSSGISNIQGKYLFLAMLFGFGGGVNTAPAAWGFDIYPYGQILVCFYGAVITYAILRYNIMDIRIAITGLAVLIFVYSLVLGIPFGLAILGKQWLISHMGENWVWVPMLTLLILATAGPFVFIYFQRRTAERILREQRRVHDVIKKASAGMVGIREMAKLLNVLTRVLKDNLRLEYISVYLFEPNENSYFLKESKPESLQNPIIQNNKQLFEYLKKIKKPISYEEMLHIKDNQKTENQHINQIVQDMQELSASVIIPAIKKDDNKDEDVLLAFIVLGKKKGKEVFSLEDLDLLKVVGNEVALAIEIILSLIERDRLLNENFEIRRFESLGLLCNSMSHQVNNRFQSIVNLLLNPLDIFSDGKYKEYPKEELIELLEDFANSSKKIDLISKEGGKITKDILNFSRGKMEFGIVNFDEAVEKSINFLEQKHLKFKCEIKRDYPKDVLVWGSELNLKDLIYNALDNSCFSMQTKQERGEEYTPSIIIRGRSNETMFHLEIEDNGIGIKKEDLNKVMDPMFTTKGHNKGSGMGTTFMQQIVQKHGGTISYESEWDKWARVKISLPLANNNLKGE